MIIPCKGYECLDLQNLNNSHYMIVADWIRASPKFLCTQFCTAHVSRVVPDDHQLSEHIMTKYDNTIVKSASSMAGTLEIKNKSMSSL